MRGAGKGNHMSLTPNLIHFDRLLIESTPAQMPYKHQVPASAGSVKG